MHTLPHAQNERRRTLIQGTNGDFYGAMPGGGDYGSIYSFFELCHLNGGQPNERTAYFDTNVSVR
jgi:hypothetical protein